MLAYLLLPLQGDEVTSAHGSPPAGTHVPWETPSPPAKKARTSHTFSETVNHTYGQQLGLLCTSPRLPPAPTGLFLPSLLPPRHLYQQQTGGYCFSPQSMVPMPSSLDLGTHWWTSQLRDMNIYNFQAVNRQTS